MYMIAEVSQYVAVASFAEAWIEISSVDGETEMDGMSPPSRRRGLKWHTTATDGLFRGRLLRGGVD